MSTPLAAIYDALALTEHNLTSTVLLRTNCRQSNSDVHCHKPGDHHDDNDSGADFTCDRKKKILNAFRTEMPHSPYLSTTAGHYAGKCQEGTRVELHIII